METLEKIEAPARQGLMHRARVRVAVVMATVAAFVIGGVAPANAVTPDPTGGAASGFLSDITDWVTDYGVPLVFGLLLLGVIIAVAIKYARKGARAV